MESMYRIGVEVHNKLQRFGQYTILLCTVMPFNF